MEKKLNHNFRRPRFQNKINIIYIVTCMIAYLTITLNIPTDILKEAENKTCLTVLDVAPLRCENHSWFGYLMALGHVTND